MRLLARSTPLGGYPASWLAVTQPQEGVPALVVVTQPAASAAAKATRLVPLLDGAQVRAFPSLSSGTAFSAPAGLAITPEALVTAYAKSLVHPSPSPLPKTVAADPFAAQVRAAETQLADGVKGAGSATSTQRILPGTTTVTQADGGALVLATLERTTTITVTEGAEVATPAAFQAAKGPKTLKHKGTWVTQEALAFEVPKGAGQAHLVGADERTVSASGS
ncbi:hypothetical protein GCM10025862_22520 [Arsenicicoccus piscis]|uniref:Uncharacterized protein n=1 Tax=Arsenicicoccus piscis TaxID=673954 RepID=A0ABQ6HP47_9MICO|nr:hypothetical protein GCM10025862_22520 [Arsenicicoccus piscis]